MLDRGIAYYRRFLNGDEEGLTELISLYRHGLLRFIYGYVRDEALAEDVLCDVFLALYYKRSFKEQDGASLKTYLYKIARNKSLNLIKKQKRRREVSLDATQKDGTGSLATLLESKLPTPDSALEKKERSATLFSALGCIKKEYAEVLLLRYFEDLDVESIATVTKRNKKQVYNLLARGKAALKEELLLRGVDYEDF